LNQNELEVMRILWQDGPLKPAEIQERFSWEIENATLRSVLRLLMDKGKVGRRKQGKAYHYRARVKRSTQLSQTARRLAFVFAGGSAGDLILELVKSEKLTPQEIDELRRVAARKTASD
ncbi:MAG: BlaI/MecI/CopY family transcriptional regulator, partial [Planctomycetota bacterium]|nr:BlaI/MecI/CopY family transcriptional regulator [Planctomycetota bacterium]